MNKQHFSQLRRRTQRGMAMVEAMIAVVILAIGVIGTLGLQMYSQRALNEAGMRSEATIAATELIGVMNADPANLSEYALSADGTPGERIAPWHDALQALLPGASAVVEVSDPDDAGLTEVVIQIQWKRDPAEAVNTHRIVTYLSAAA